QKLGNVISGLGNRVFLMNNVHDDQPVPFQTRWALSFLRGPLSREQIQELMKKRKEGAKPQAPAEVTSAPAPQAAAATAPAVRAETTAPVAGAAPESAGRPVLPPEVSECFLPLPRALQPGESVTYKPALFGTARVHFVQSKSNVDDWKT